MELALLLLFAVLLIYIFSDDIDHDKRFTHRLKFFFMYSDGRENVRVFSSIPINRYMTEEDIAKACLLNAQHYAGAREILALQVIEAITADGPYKPKLSL